MEGLKKLIVAGVILSMIVCLVAAELKVDDFESCGNQAGYLDCKDCCEGIGGQIKDFSEDMETLEGKYFLKPGCTCAVKANSSRIRNVCIGRELECEECCAEHGGKPSKMSYLSIILGEGCTCKAIKS